MRRAGGAWWGVAREARFVILCRLCHHGPSWCSVGVLAGDGTSALGQFGAHSGVSLGTSSPAPLGGLLPRLSTRLAHTPLLPRPAFPLASLLPAESYDEYVNRCAVSVGWITSTCPQDGKGPPVPQPPALGMAAPRGGGVFPPQWKLAMFLSLGKPQPG